MLKKDEYKCLYFINYGNNTLEKLNIILSLNEPKIKYLIKNLYKKGLIKINYIDKEIYSFMETQEGLYILKSEEYHKQYLELGD
jgi:hypothetical protein